MRLSVMRLTRGRLLGIGRTFGAAVLLGTARRNAASTRIPSIVAVVWALTGGLLTSTDIHAYCHTIYWSTNVPTSNNSSTTTSHSQIICLKPEGDPHPGSRDGSGRSRSTTQSDTDFESKSNCQSSPTTGAPVLIASGKKLLVETDFSPANEDGALLKRYYAHDGRGTGLFGARWTSSYDYALVLNGATSTNPSSTIYSYRPAGARYSYKWNATRQQYIDKKADAIAYIVPSGSNWELHTEDQTVETYNSKGRILQIVDRTGRKTSFAYDTDNRLSTVTPPSGKALTFKWLDGRVQTITDPRSLAYTYSYEGLYLTKVVGAD